MRERPILFSTPMVRAILEGRKTQTRRVVKVQPPERTYRVMPYHHPDPRQHFYAWVDSDPPRDICACSDWCQPCPYGQPGDRLWVRETWGVVSHAFDDAGEMIDWTPDRPATPIHAMPFGKGYYSGHVIYAADGNFEWCDDDGDGEKSCWHPSIHMTRAASRILLEVVSVRVERLQDISEADAKAEGIDKTASGFWSLYGQSDVDSTYSPRTSYRALWESINGPEPWEANPWVWVVEFKNVASREGT